MDTSVTLLLVLNISLLGVWISDETLLIVLNILLLGVRISDETLVIVFDILLLSAWISDETILLVFYILLRILQTEQFFSCWKHYLQKSILRKGHQNFFIKAQLIERWVTLSTE